MFETFDHTADIGLRVAADTLKDLFAEATLGLYTLLCPDLESVRSEERRNIVLPFPAAAGEACEPDYAELLHDWLAEVLYVFDVERFLACRVHVSFHEGELHGVLEGERFDADRHTLDLEIKAVTYHGLTVERTAEGWRAEIIFDL
ncbi:archease [Thermostilla marina]